MNKKRNDQPIKNKNVEIPPRNWSTEACKKLASAVVEKAVTDYRKNLKGNNDRWKKTEIITFLSGDNLFVGGFLDLEGAYLVRKMHDEEREAEKKFRENFNKRRKIKKEDNKEKNNNDDNCNIIS